MKTESQNLKIESQKLEGPKPRENRITIAKQNPKIPERGTHSLRGCADFSLKTFSCFCAVYFIFSKNLDAGFRKSCGWEMHGTSIPFQDP